ncbi:hypothetical protein MKW98_016210 [Papaver atlanticum]|uniref:RNase H type-1 domain-containing protein n=1 Tax=Papaver atlanticum TaxID=357466 RepID=A0AAD4SH69_9MAGN|nr:hypothetical protein MKW98_016210 [Papaver atlanticum]
MHAPPLSLERLLHALSLQGAPNETPKANRAAYLVRWNPPDSNFVKLNVDGASTDAGMAGTGGILRASDGHFLAAFARHIYHSSNNVAELWAIRDGLKLASSLGMKRLVVESDSKYAVNVCKGLLHGTWLCI